MSRFAQFGLAALLASSAIAAPVAALDVVTVYVTAPLPNPTAAPAPAPVAPKVKAPKVKAPKVKAPKVKAPATNVKFPSLGNKAGLPYNDGSLTSLFAGTKVSWAYDWVSSPQGVCPTMEFVPMLHDLTSTFTSVWQSEASAAIASGSKHLLYVNEPDLAPGTGGTGISVSDAVAGYKQYMQPFVGKAKLGSPGVTNGAAPMGISYLQDFVAACDGCHFDFMAIHWYDQCTNVAYFKQHLQEAHAAFPDYPIWLSEFGCYGSDDQVATFLDQVQPWMDSTPWIQRYAYFMAEEGKLVSGGAPSVYGAKYASL